MAFIALTTVNSKWLFKDFWGSLKVRSSIGRNNYIVNPGLYRFGNPGQDDPVFVTANYKLSFDVLRKNLKGMNAWVLVLQTYGINVWCAAGKGTFGTKELVRQIKISGLENIVSHRKIIVPQLGAPGVSGYHVKNETGFNVEFGPVRAKDIKDYLAAGCKKSESMRSVKFNFIDRLILTPVEIVNSLRYLLYIMIAVTLLSGIGPHGYSLSAIKQDGIPALLYILSAYISGAFITPVLLPWIPSRYFAAKGLFVGSVIYALIAGLVHSPEKTIACFLGWLFISAAISSFLAMNFTGSSTFTSLSGVKKEMKLFVPIQIILIIIGLVLVILSKWV